MAKVGPLAPGRASKTLAHRFTRVADNLRQLETKFGIRPYRCFLVWTRWDGGERGKGTPLEIGRTEILPTPNLKSLDNLALDPRAAGILPVGMVRLTEISTSLTYEQLKGLAVPGQPLLDHIPQPFGFYYEVYEDDRSGVGAQVRRKFRPATEPNRDAENVQWTITLERVSEDSNRDGSSSYNEGTQG